MDEVSDSVVRSLYGVEDGYERDESLFGRIVCLNCWKKENVVVWEYNVRNESHIHWFIFTIENIDLSHIFSLFLLFLRKMRDMGVRIFEEKMSFFWWVLKVWDVNEWR